MKYWAQYFCCIFVILFFAYVNSASHKEGFIPKVREYYRPIARKTRLWKEQFFHMPFLNNRLKRMGIL